MGAFRWRYLGRRRYLAHQHAAERNAATTRGALGLENSGLDIASDWWVGSVGAD